MTKKSLRQYCLAVFLSLFLTACGTAGSPTGNTSLPVETGSADSAENSSSMTAESNLTVQTPEWVYVPQILSIGAENVDYDDISLAGDTFCYLSRGGDVDNAVREICQYSIPDQKLTTIPVGWQEEAGNREIGYYTFAGDGSLYLVANIYSADYSQLNRYLCKFDPTGKQTLSQNLAEQVDRSMYVSGISADAQGRIYIFTNDSGILLYEADGNFHGSIVSDFSENAVFKDAVNGNDDSIYVCYGKDSDPDYCMLAQVDFEVGQLTEIDNSLSGIMGFCAGAAQDGDPAHQCDFLLYDDSYVYTYDMATQERRELFAWLDSDINGSSVESFGLSEDGKIYAAYEDWNIDDVGLTLLTRTNSEQVAQKEYLTLAAVNSENSLAATAYRSFATALDPEYRLTASAVHFNKNNFQYHVTVKIYDSMNDLYSAILTGESIDLISLSGLNVQKMCAQGIFEDLNPYLDQGSAIGRDDFLDGILDTYTFDGTLVSIPATFMLQTVMGSGEQAGDQSGMTLEEFFTAVDQHPEAMAFGEVTKEEMLQYLMMFNEEAFIDWNTGECRFDSAEFKNLLEFVKQFPDVMDDSKMKEESLPTMIQNGKVMFAIADIYAVSAIQPYGDMFHGNAVPVGFPAVDGKKGNLLITGDAFAMAAGSGHKEAAWAFIEKELFRGNESCYPDASLLPTYFPTMKEVFRTVMEDKIESNNQIAADRFPMRIYEDGWTFTFHAVNWDEINAVLDLLKNARPAFSAGNDDIVKIIYEEAQAYYSGQKSVEDVAGIIQNRVSLYVSENM